MLPIDLLLPHLLKLATISVVETLEQFDWTAGSGATEAPILVLSHLAFVARAENVVLLGPLAWQNPYSPRVGIPGGYGATRSASLPRPISCYIGYGASPGPHEAILQ